MAGKKKVKKASKDAPEGGIADLHNKVSEALDADVIAYDGEIGATCDSLLIRHCEDRHRRKNVLLLIHTHGGSADVAYAIARCLQRKYERFTIYLNGCCKSAGTLIAIGADELVIPDHGELGPLNVQVAKPDELGEASSGLTLPNALATLKPQAFDLWEYFFLQIKSRSLGQITTKTSSEIAAAIVGHLFAPIYAQIDPHRLGEIERDLRISVEYGERLARNLMPDALERLVGSYPSHEFVIDREEATTLFNSVREPSGDEAELAGEVGDVVYPALRSMKLPLAFLDDIIPVVTPKEEKNGSADNNGTRAGTTKAKGSRSRANGRKDDTIRAGRRDGKGTARESRSVLGRARNQKASPLARPLS